MTKSELLELGISEDLIPSLMKINGKDIENAKSKFADYEELREKLSNAEKTLEGFSDYENVKAEVEKYKAENKKIQEEHAQKIATMERQNRIKEYTSSKKFINDFTRDSINNLLDVELQKEESKGKSLDDIFATVTEGKENLFMVENKITPPSVPTMSTEIKDDVGKQNMYRAVMGLKPLE